MPQRQLKPSTSQTKLMTFTLTHVWASSTANHLHKHHLQAPNANLAKGCLPALFSHPHVQVTPSPGASPPKTFWNFRSKYLHLCTGCVIVLNRAFPGTTEPLPHPPGTPCLPAAGLLPITSDLPAHTSLPQEGPPGPGPHQCVTVTSVLSGLFLTKSISLLFPLEGNKPEPP